MNRLFLPVATLAAIVAATPAGAAMTTGTFVTRARALQAQGMAAVLNPDFQTLRSEANEATQQLKADRAARQAAGKKPVACVPEGQSIGIIEMLDGLDALSPAEKRLPLKDGYAHVLARRFPCW
jgi:hypothetical protein